MKPSAQVPIGGVQESHASTLYAGTDNYRWLHRVAYARYAKSVTDAALIAYFPQALKESLPIAEGTEPVAVHAELLHRLCLADGLLEVLEWGREGLGADPLACMWLGSLRWYRLVHGAYPEGAPEPPARPTDALLHSLMNTGVLQVQPGTGLTSLQSLSGADMHYPSAPAAPEAEDQDVLLRLAPLAVVPFIDDQIRQRWVEQNVALTHGHPEVLHQAQELVATIHRQALEAAEHQVEATLHGDVSQQHSDTPWTEVLADLEARWKAATATV